MMSSKDVQRTVVIAMDGSVHSEYAFKWYTENMKHPNDNVVLVHCIERHAAFHGGMYTDRREALYGALGTADIQSVCNIIEEEKHTEQKLQDTLTNKLNSNGLKGSVQTPVGNPGEVVIAHVNKVQADHIICGSRGHGKLRRTLLGSISDYILHHSDVPVIVCRHKHHTPHFTNHYH